MIVSRGLGRPSGVSVSGGMLVAHALVKFTQIFGTLLRMRSSSVEGTPLVKTVLHDAKQVP